MKQRIVRLTNKPKDKPEKPPKKTPLSSDSSVRGRFDDLNYQVVHELVLRLLAESDDPFIGVRFKNNTKKDITTGSQRYLGIGAKTTLYFFGIQKQDIYDVLQAGATILEIIEADDGMPRLFNN